MRGCAGHAKHEDDDMIAPCDVSTFTHGVINCTTSVYHMLSYDVYLVGGVNLSSSIKEEGRTLCLSIVHGRV